MITLLHLNAGGDNKEAERTIETAQMHNDVWCGVRVRTCTYVYVRSRECACAHSSHVNNTSDMQGMVWGEPELSHVWEFDHMVFFHSHK